MSVQILSGGELVYDPWPRYGDWSVFEGDVGRYRSSRHVKLDPLTVWKQQRNVRTVVGFLARNYAQVRAQAFRMNDNGDRERLRPPDPLATLLARPAPNVLEYDFAHTRLVDLAIYDRWAALKVLPDADQPWQLLRLPPRKWRFVRDSTDMPVAVRIWSNDAERYVDVDLERFVWLDGYPTPDGDATPMEFLFDLLTEETESARARIAMWRNGARISGIIERPSTAPTWESHQRARFAQKWRDAFTRATSTSGAGAGGTPILEDGMTYKQVDQLSPRQAEQIEARRLSMAEVCAAFHVSPTLLGFMQGTYSNVQAFREMLYSETLGPAFMRTKQAFDARVVPDVAERPGTDYVEHNVAEKLRLSFEDQARILQTATGGPWMLRSEARQRMNLPALPEDSGADELIVPLNVIAGGQASPTDSRPDLRALDEPTRKEQQP